MTNFKNVSLVQLSDYGQIAYGPHLQTLHPVEVELSASMADFLSLPAEESTDSEKSNDLVAAYASTDDPALRSSESSGWIDQKDGRRDLAKAIAARTGQDAKAVDIAIKGFAEVVVAAISKGWDVAIPHFAKVHERRAVSQIRAQEEGPIVTTCRGKQANQAIAVEGHGGKALVCSLKGPTEIEGRTNGLIVPRPPKRARTTMTSLSLCQEIFGSGWRTLVPHESRSLP